MSKGKIYRVSTGYFARATEDGHNAKHTKVHLIKNGGLALCGYRPHPTMEYQFCADRPILHYVECDKCKQKYLDDMNGVFKELNDLRALEFAYEAARKAKYGGKKKLGIRYEIMRRTSDKDLDSLKRLIEEKQKQIDQL